MTAGSLEVPHLSAVQADAGPSQNPCVSLIWEAVRLMTTDQVLFGGGLIPVLAVGSQVLASRLRISALEHLAAGWLHFRRIHQRC
jgi:hypothetical protein